MSDAGIQVDTLASVGPSTKTPEIGPGAQLCAQRQVIGWTIEQVASQLNLSQRQVQALEDDNYAALPSMVVARGFVGSYAKLLKLNPAALLAMIPAPVPSNAESLALRRTLSANFTESNLSMGKRSGSGGKHWAAWLVLAVVIVATWLAWQEGLLKAWLPEVAAVIEEQLDKPELLASETGDEVVLGQAKDEAAIVSSSVAPVVATHSAIAAASTVVSSLTSTTQLTQTTQPSATQTSAAVAVVQQKSGEMLTLKMREASWIEIKSESGEAIALRLIPAGATQSFDIGADTLLVVGNAAGVDATFRGKAIDLSGNAKNNVARVKLN